MGSKKGGLRIRTAAEGVYREEETRLEQKVKNGFWMFTFLNLLTCQLLLLL